MLYSFPLFGQYFSSMVFIPLPFISRWSLLCFSALAETFPVRALIMRSFQTRWPLHYFNVFRRFRRTWIVRMFLPFFIQIQSLYGYLMRSGIEIGTIMESFWHLLQPFAIDLLMICWMYCCMMYFETPNGSEKIRTPPPPPFSSFVRIYSAAGGGGGEVPWLTVAPFRLGCITPPGPRRLLNRKPWPSEPQL